MKNGKLLGRPKTRTYEQQRLYHFQQYRQLPPFTFQMISYMLHDSTVQLGLTMRMAPILQAEWVYREDDEWITGIRAESEEVGEFVLRELRRFWKHEVQKMLLAQVWGWSAAEVCYHRDPLTNLISIDRTLHRHAKDVVALTRDGDVAGVKFGGLRKDAVKLEFPKCYWYSFAPECENPYGKSVLRGAYSAWCDKNLQGGATDVRRLFMHKDAYGGVDVSYPPGTTDTGDGDPELNRDIARGIAEQLQAGGITARPSTVDPTTGKEMWTITRATIPGSPAHILQYPKDLDVEILRGLEIPDDVLTSENTGAWQGKQVPMMAFYTNLDRQLADVIRVVQKQLLEPLVLLNFRKAYGFEICAKPLAEQVMEQAEQKEDNAPMSPQMMQMFNRPQQFSLEESLSRGVVRAADLVTAGRVLLDSTGAVESDPLTIQEAADIAGLSGSEVQLLGEYVRLGSVSAGSSDAAAALVDLTEEEAEQLRDKLVEDYKENDGILKERGET